MRRDPDRGSDCKREDGRSLTHGANQQPTRDSSTGIDLFVPLVEPKSVNRALLSSRAGIASAEKHERDEKLVPSQKGWLEHLAHAGG